MTAPPPSPARVLELAPQLHEIVRQARADRRLEGRERWVAYEAHKRAVSRLAGWDAQNPELRSWQAYGVALDLVRDALGV